MIISIVQDGPVFNNKKQTIQKTIELVGQAKKGGADLVVFGETWLCGYPVWIDICRDAALWDHEPVKSIWADMYDSAIDLSSRDFDKLKKVVTDEKIWAVMGMNEKITKGPGNGTLINAVLTISDKGEIVNHHRKLMPSYSEKLVHGVGDGAALNSVKTPFGNLEALICWEHWMPMARQVMHDEAEDLHIALWPYVKEMHQVCSRQYAFEGRCHVVSVGQIMKSSELPEGLELVDNIQKEDLVLKGGSCIYGPDGSEILKPLYSERKIIFEELDLSVNTKEKMNLAVSGHYFRPDVFELKIDKSRSF